MTMEWDKKTDELLSDRIVFIGAPMDDANVNLTIAQMLFLENQDPRAFINMLIDSPGGYVSAALAVYDTQLSISNPIRTVCIGKGHGMAGLLVAAGTKGHRSSLPGATFQLGPIAAGKVETNRDFEELDRLHDRIAEILAQLTGRPTEVVRADMALSATMDAAGARQYGLIDEIATDPWVQDALRLIVA